jgi:hypothetical protein
MPCAPGGRPVPIEAMLTAVVDGNPAVRSRPAASASASTGASAAWALINSAPRPSISNTQAAPAGGRPRASSNPGVPIEASTEGIRSASDDVP